MHFVTLILIDVFKCRQYSVLILFVLPLDFLVYVHFQVIYLHDNELKLLIKKTIYKQHVNANHIIFIPIDIDNKTSYGCRQKIVSRAPSPFTRGVIYLLRYLWHMRLELFV